MILIIRVFIDSVSSLKRIVFLAGILVDLIPNIKEAIEPYRNNQNPSIEIVKRSLKLFSVDQSKTDSGAKSESRLEQKLLFGKDSKKFI